MKYSQKLRDPRWQKKRLEILSRDDFKCTICGDKETELHVHHKKYKGDPWEVENDDLQTLCKHCHAIAHIDDLIMMPDYNVIKKNDEKFVFVFIKNQVAAVSYLFNKGSFKPEFNGVLCIKHLKEII